MIHETRVFYGQIVNTCNNIDNSLTNFRKLSNFFSLQIKIIKFLSSHMLY